MFESIKLFAMLLVVAAMVGKGSYGSDKVTGQLRLQITGIENQDEQDSSKIELESLAQYYGIYATSIEFNKRGERNSQLQLLQQRGMAFKDVSKILLAFDRWAEVRKFPVSSRSVATFDVANPDHYCNISVYVSGVEKQSERNTLYYDLLEKTLHASVDLEFEFGDESERQATFEVESVEGTPHKQVAAAMSVANEWCLANQIENRSLAIRLVPPEAVRAVFAGPTEQSKEIAAANTQSLAEQVENQERLTFEVSRPGKGSATLVEKAVARSFELKQKLLALQIQNLKSKIRTLELQLEKREANAQEIIGRRVKELMKPDFKWHDTKRSADNDFPKFEASESQRIHDDYVFEVYKIPETLDAKLIADVLVTILKEAIEDGFRFDQTGEVISLFAPPKGHDLSKKLIEAMVHPKKATQVTAATLEDDRQLIVYRVPEGAEKDMYNVLSTLLEGTEVRLAVDEKTHSLLLLANETGHEIARDGLKKVIGAEAK